MRFGTLALLLAACGPAAEPQGPAWPPGTVLAVDGRPITAEEVDRAARPIALLYPARSARFHRTQALESFVLPREALRSAYPGRRAAARTACEATRQRLLEGADPTELGATLGTGGPLLLTPFLWDAARQLEPLIWSEPIERIGFFSLVQLVDRSGPTRPENEEIVTLRVIDHSWAPPDFGPADLDAAMSAARLEVVDPDWADMVPERLRYQMRGGG